MTLLTTVLSQRGIWQCTDHLLTGPKGPLPDLSSKHVFLEAADGKALIGYAGIGRISNTDVSEWCWNVLRGEYRTLEEHVHMLRNAATRNLLQYSMRDNTPHAFIVAGYKDRWPTFYGISNCCLRNGVFCAGDEFRITGIRLDGTPKQVIISREGIGAVAIPQTDMRKLVMRRVKSRMNKPTLNRDVSAALAHLNTMTSRHPKSLGKVGRKCIVRYLAGPDANLSSRHYGWAAGEEMPQLSALVIGSDRAMLAHGLASAMGPYLKKHFQAIRNGESSNVPFPPPEFNELLAKINAAPSDKFK